jgi:hypothetical protein
MKISRVVENDGLYFYSDEDFLIQDEEMILLLKKIFIFSVLFTGTFLLWNQLPCYAKEFTKTRKKEFPFVEVADQMMAEVEQHSDEYYMKLFKAVDYRPAKYRLKAKAGKTVAQYIKAVKIDSSFNLKQRIFQKNFQAEVLNIFETMSVNEVQPSNFSSLKLKPFIIDGRIYRSTNLNLVGNSLLKPMIKNSSILKFRGGNFSILNLGILPTVLKMIYDQSIKSLGNKLPSIAIETATSKKRDFLKKFRTFFPVALSIIFGGIYKDELANRASSFKEVIVGKQKEKVQNIYKKNFYQSISNTFSFLINHPILLVFVIFIILNRKKFISLFESQSERTRVLMESYKFLNKIVERLDLAYKANISRLEETGSKFFDLFHSYTKRDVEEISGLRTKLEKSESKNQYTQSNFTILDANYRILMNNLQRCNESYSIYESEREAKLISYHNFITLTQSYMFSVAEKDNTFLQVDNPLMNHLKLLSNFNMVLPKTNTPEDFLNLQLIQFLRTDENSKSSQNPIVQLYEFGKRSANKYVDDVPGWE